jgi:lysophospholipase L1-like esterase
MPRGLGKRIPVAFLQEPWQAGYLLCRQPSAMVTALMRLLLAPAALLAAIIWGSVGWGLLAYWVLKGDPWHRPVLASHAGRVLGRESAVVLVGDSIMESVGSPCSAFANLAVSGARARDVPAELVAEVAKLKPAAILIMFGINDLRRGTGPVETAQSIAELARRFQAAVSDARVVVLVPLPLTQNSIAEAADNVAVRKTAARLQDELTDDNIRVIDLSALFGKGELSPELTKDGLHLNAVGISRLTAVIEAVAVAAGARACR